MSFHVGQKVKCVKVGKWTDAAPDEDVPVLGQVYTIRQLYTEEGDLFLVLVELKNRMYQTIHGPMEPGYWSIHFRPLRETDISIFKAMLVTPPKQRVSA